MNTRNTLQIIRSFFYYPHTLSTTRNVQKWLIESGNTTEKEEILYQIWNESEVKIIPAHYQALKKVKAKLGISPHQNHFLLTRPFRNIAAIFIPLLLIAISLYFIQRQTINRITTCNKEQKHITLPDGSEVWLNSESTISYTSQFGASIREINLQGEAYFSVFKDPGKPFIVKTEEFKIQALGTEFNVTAYHADSRVITTLTKGKIQVNIITNPIDSAYILEPGRQIIYQRSNKSIQLETVKGNSTAWKNRQLIFQDATLQDIFNTLQRHYDVTIHYNPAEFPNDTYSVKFIDQENIGQILNVLQDIIGQFHYQQDKKNITIKKY